MHLSECYRLLGVPRNATLDDIKVAYRRLARKYHPDVNQNDPASIDKFRLVQEAYTILKDADKADLSKEIFANTSTKAPARSPSTPSSKAPHPKIKIEVKQVNNQVDPINSDPELKLKLDMLRRVQDLLKQKICCRDRGSRRDERKVPKFARSNPLEGCNLSSLE